MNPLIKAELLQLIMNHIPQYIFWKDIEGVYLGCNTNFAKSAGLSSPSDIIGKNDYDMPWSKEDADFYRKTDREVMASGEAALNFEEPQTRDGQEYWLRTSKIPLHDSKGNVIGILGTYEDITIQKNNELALKKSSEQLLQVNEDLRATNRKLEVANTALENYAFATSHDLQEPLRTIGSFVTLLERRYGTSLKEDGKSYIKYIVRGVNRMSKLIKSILTYSRLQALEDSYEYVDFELMIDKILKEQTNELNQEEVQVILKMPDNPVFCHQLSMDRLWNNLINNALKFNTSKVKRLWITYEESPEDWVFIIKDNGLGIDTEYKEYIFEPFKKVHTIEEDLGSGLGLAICQRIITAHSGAIWVESSTNGSTFFIKLPKYQAKST